MAIIYKTLEEFKNSIKDDEVYSLTSYVDGSGKYLRIGSIVETEMRIYKSLGKNLNYAEIEWLFKQQK